MSPELIVSFVLSLRYAEKLPSRWGGGTVYAVFEPKQGQLPGWGWLQTAARQFCGPAQQNPQERTELWAAPRYRRSLALPMSPPADPIPLDPGDPGVVLSRPGGLETLSFSPSAVRGVATKLAR
jgi:hypothetical protein